MESAIPMLRWAAAALGLLAFLWLSALNWSVAWQTLVRRQPAPSWTPLLGGVLGALGLVALPWPGSSGFWWLPLFLDWGSIPGVAHALVWHALHRDRPS